MKHQRKRQEREKAISGKTWSEMTDKERLSTRQKLRAFLALRSAAESLLETRLRKEV
jgi:hypothetical protein